MERAPGQTAWKATDQLEIELTYMHTKGDRSKLLRRNGKPVSTEYEKVEGATPTVELVRSWRCYLRRNLENLGQRNFGIGARWFLTSRSRDKPPITC